MRDLTGSFLTLMHSERYFGAILLRHLNTISPSLNSIRCFTGRKWASFRNGVTESHFLITPGPNRKRAQEFSEVSSEQNQVSHTKDHCNSQV